MTKEYPKAIKLGPLDTSRCPQCGNSLQHSCVEMIEDYPLVLCCADCKTHFRRMACFEELIDVIDNISENHAQAVPMKTFLNLQRFAREIMEGR